MVFKKSNFIKEPTLYSKDIPVWIIIKNE